MEVKILFKRFHRIISCLHMVTFFTSKTSSQHKNRKNYMLGTHLPGRSVNMKRPDICIHAHFSLRTGERIPEGAARPPGCQRDLLGAGTSSNRAQSPKSAPASSQQPTSNPESASVPAMRVPWPREAHTSLGAVSSVPSDLEGVLPLL